MGVQSMTLSVSAMAAAEAEAAAAAEAEKQEDSKSPQPSIEEQDKVLGSLGGLQMVSTPSVEAKRAAGLKRLSEAAEVEAEVEHLRVADYVGEAPMQRVEENEL